MNFFFAVQELFLGRDHFRSVLREGFRISLFLAHNKEHHANIEVFFVFSVIIFPPVCGVAKGSGERLQQTSPHVT